MPTDVANIILVDTTPSFVSLAQTNRNWVEFIVMPSAVGKIGLNAVKASSTKIILTFGAVAASVNTTAGNYVVSGPSVVTVTAVSYTPGDTFATLTYSGGFVPGSYTMAVTPSSIVDLQNNFNTADPFPVSSLPIGGAGSVFNVGIN